MADTIENRQPTGRVTPVHISDGGVTSGFFESMYATAQFDADNLGLLTGMVSIRSGARLNQGRTDAIRSFLAEPTFAEVEWLWLVDTDMTFANQALYDLLAVADPEERPIVGGLCFAGGHSDMCEPTLYYFQESEGSIDIRRPVSYHPNALVPVDATGAAFLVVHRTVFERMAEEFATTPDGFQNPHPWFAELIVAGESIGEDMAFCRRARQMGYPIYVHTGVKTGHNKAHDLTEELWLARGGKHSTDAVGFKSNGHRPKTQLPSTPRGRKKARR